MTNRKTPLIIELDSEALPDAPSPAEAAQPLDTAVATEQMIAIAARPPRWGLGSWLAATLVAFLGLWLGVTATEFIAGLFERYTWLGWVGTGLLGFLVLLLAGMALREITALARLRRIGALRDAAVDALETGSARATERVLTGLRRLYDGRAELEWARDSMNKALADAPDPTDRLALAERTLMEPLDEAAEAAVIRASRNVAAATALIPLALADVLAALTCNLRMVREISEIYGGRAGLVGSWRLMKAVAAHLVATGAVAVADDLIGPMVGGGVLGKLSRRFGEGAVNGALTARVGVAAMEICRPMPFAERDAPKASAIVLGALKAWRREESR